jgi:hypothetical protein
MGVAPLCHYHHLKLPRVGHCNRICIHFEASAQYWLSNGTDTPPARRFTWFTEDLKPRVLYLFHYNMPGKITDRISMDSLTKIGGAAT